MRSSDNTWNPGHSVNNGYPFDGIASKALLPLEDRAIIYASSDVIDARYKEALNCAEQQIADILEEHPLNPEALGFEVAYSNPPGGAPVKIYVSKYDDRFSLFRKPGMPDDEGYSPMNWILTQKNDDGTLKEVEVKLPCQRIAYAALWSLGVEMKSFVENIVDEMRERIRQGNAALDEFNHRPYNPPEGKMSGIFPLMNFTSSEDHLLDEPAAPKSFTHKVEFYREIELEGFKNVPYRRYEYVNATDDKEALTKAKFLLETDTEDHFTDVKFEELTIIR